MKVKAKPEFRTLRNQVLKLEVKDFRALQSGKIVDVKKEVVDKYEKFFEKVVKDGD